MLKNIVKAGLIAAMMVGGTHMAMAEGESKDTQGPKPVVAESFVKLNARYSQYFGQFDKGTEGYAAHFQNYGETGVHFSGEVGKARFFIESEFRSGAEDVEYFDVIARASYITPVGLVTIGKVTNYMAQQTANAGGGVKGANGGLGSQAASTAAGNTENDGIDWMVPIPMGDGSLVLELTMWDKAATRFRTMEPIRSGGEGINQSDKGSTMAFGAMYKGGPIIVKAGMTTETMDDYSTDADTAETNTYNQVSAMLTLGNISIDASSVGSTMKGINSLALMSEILDSLDATSRTVLTGVLGGIPDAELKTTVLGLGLTVKDLGLGDLHINYEDVVITDTNLDYLETMYNMSGNAMFANMSWDKKIAKISLFYSIYHSERIGYQIVYDQKAITPTFGDSNTVSYVGVGLFGYY